MTFIAFAQYLVPLALSEIYLHGRHGAPALRVAMAAGLAAVTATIWVSDIKAGLDARRSIADALAIENDQKSVDLNPGNANAMKMVEKLRAPSH